MKIMDTMTGLREQSKLDRRVKYDGHNRRPLALSRKRLARRRARRRRQQTLDYRVRRNRDTVVCKWAR